MTIPYEFIIDATPECLIHEKFSHRLVSEPLRMFNYKKVREAIGDIFELPDSASFMLISTDYNNDPASIVNQKELADTMGRPGMNPLVLKVVQECSSPILKVVHGDTHHLLIRPPRQVEYCYERFHEQVRDLFKLPPITQFAFSYDEPNFCGPAMTVASDAELNYALVQASPNNLKLDIRIINDPYVVKILYKGSLRRLTLAPDKLQFSYENLRSRILNLFKLSPAAELVLSYIDKDQDKISIVGDEDLSDALVLQSLHPLMVNLTIGGGTRYPNC